jgi:hypothetical protein
MKFSSTWTMALRALRRNPLRTGLTKRKKSQNETFFQKVH